MIGYVLTAWGWLSKLLNWKKLSKKVSGWCSWEVVACVAAVGVIACIYFLVDTNLKLKADVDKAKQEQATEKARYKTDLAEKDLAYKNQAVALKAYQSMLNAIDCDGEWTQETAPDGTAKMKCVGTMRQSTSSTKTSDSTTKPIFAPPVIPSAAMNCPECVLPRYSLGAAWVIGESVGPVAGLRVYGPVWVSGGVLAPLGAGKVKAVVGAGATF